MDYHHKVKRYRLWGKYKQIYVFGINTLDKKYTHYMHDGLQKLIYDKFKHF